MPLNETATKGGRIGPRRGREEVDSLARRLLYGRRSTRDVLRAWWSRPRNRGAAVSSLLHTAAFLALFCCVWGAQRPVARPPEIAAALVESPETAVVEFDLNPLEPIGGSGGGALLLPTEAPYADAAPPGSHEDPLTRFIAPPDLPADDLPPGPGVGRGRGAGRGDGRGSLRPPGKNAITEGSFTVWTVPDDPLPGETYSIVIEVKLPEKVARYPRSDLAGVVIGTDGWRQPLPGTATPLLPYLPVQDHVVQLQVDVPGGGRRVKDTVQVRSKMLKEERTLTIEF